MSVEAAPVSPVSAWLLASRPRTLTAAVAPIVAGTAIAHSFGQARALPALAALLSSLFIQVGTNLANDYSDFKRGADKERVGPVRVTQSGLIAPEVVKRAAWLCFGIAALFGVYLATAGGWPILVIGLASVASGWLYTGGPWPLGYHGLGDLFVFVFFGLVATCGTVWVQLLALPAEAWIAGAAVGATCTAVIVVNNLRDRETDARVGKNTLAVRLGVTGTRIEYALLIAAAIGLAASLGRPWALLAIVPAIPPLRRVFTASGAALNPALGETARLHLILAALIAVEVLWR